MGLTSCWKVTSGYQNPGNFSDVNTNNRLQNCWKWMLTLKKQEQPCFNLHLVTLFIQILWKKVDKIHIFWWNGCEISSPLDHLLGFFGAVDVHGTIFTHVHNGLVRCKKMPIPKAFLKAIVLWFIGEDMGVDDRWWAISEGKHGLFIGKMRIYRENMAKIIWDA